MRFFLLQINNILHILLLQKKVIGLGINNQQAGILLFFLEKRLYKREINEYMLQFLTIVNALKIL